ncbi:conserved hypothetical protein [Conexibacter woesei DSM 14684]|uniref:VOC domain-containing protein n=2 Tax=Conexibacter TaxID=191494 RepID=D3F6C9_CONWI|nr:conserved hypothetical protein [Conexibacter woesei DSM 14684]
MNPAGFRADQIGIVVHDLDRALARYERALGGGPWRIWTYGPRNVPRLTYRGADAAFEMRVALSSSVPQIELIEAISGPSIYTEWLDRHGEGLHHLGMFEEDVDGGIARMAAQGFDLMQSGRGYGRDGDGGFLYFDTAAELGVILELIEVPARRRTPEAIWPLPESVQARA